MTQGLGFFGLLFNVLGSSSYFKGLRKHKNRLHGHCKGSALKLEILNYMVEYSTSIHRNEVQT